MRFLKDPWLDIAPLQMLFPRMYSLAINKSDSVSEVGSFIAKSWSWNLEFRQACLGWELDEERRFNALLHSLLPIKGDGFLMWLGERNGVFLVNALYFQVGPIARTGSMDHSQETTTNYPSQSNFVFVASLNKQDRCQSKFAGPWGCN